MTARTPAELPRSPHATIRRAARTQDTPSLRDLLIALADEMAGYPAVHAPNGIGIKSQPNHPSPVWTAAHRFALHCLGEQEPTEPLCGDEQPSSLPGFPASYCTRPKGHPGWHYEGESFNWGEVGEKHGERDPWTGEPQPSADGQR